jgi:phage FluMu protein Com
LYEEEKEMEAIDVKASTKPVMIMVSGSVIVRCNKCGQLLSEMFKLNGGTVKCPYCKSQYLYDVKLRTKQMLKSGN